MNPNTIWQRVFSDFLMPSRLDQFREFLVTAQAAGYRTVSVTHFWDLIQAGPLESDHQPILILRHDVDTDPTTARAMWEIERSVGAEGSYYFRLSTVDLDLMRSIGESGSEASYHFEELAAVIKRRRLRDRDAIMAAVPEARERFRRNLSRLRRATGLPMRSVASHGDFVNRKARLPNWLILIDRQFRAEVGVEFETYDDDFMSRVSSRHTDAGPPVYWTPESPAEAIARRDPVIYTLTHPRQWQVDPAGNLRDDLRRVGEGMVYAVAPSVATPRATAQGDRSGAGRGAPAPGPGVQGKATSSPATTHSAAVASPPKLLVHCPTTYPAERRYVLDVVLRDWLGLDYEVVPAERGDVVIQLEGVLDASQVSLPDVLFATPRDLWLSESSMPIHPLARIDAGRYSALPILYATSAQPAGWTTTSTGRAIDVDVLGSIFFMLTRYEEVVRRLRDEHERFPAYASLGTLEGFTERPVADEYTDLLWAGLQATWPHLTRRGSTYRLRLSHDVDQPWAAVDQPVPLVVRSIGADLFERADPALAITRSRALLAARSGRISHDPFDTFELLMTTSEERGLRSTFYFMTGGTSVPLDGRYRIEDLPIGQLLRTIHDRGHEIGLHASYDSYDRPDQMSQEFEALKAACRAVGVEQGSWGVRQHYLRFEAPLTWRIQELAGFEHDSTLGFADQVGFRAGTAREFQVFDVREGRALNLRERPLILMDASLLGYMGLSLDQAMARARQVAAVVRQQNADVVVCFHNSALPGSRQRSRYRNLVRALASPGPTPSEPAVPRSGG
jgi:hypothetical protein